jgi:hypothetical protein
MSLAAASNAALTATAPSKWTRITLGRVMPPEMARFRIRRPSRTGAGSRQRHASLGRAASVGRAMSKILASWEGNPMDRRGGGWVVFAAIVLGVAGIMRIFDAIWAFSYHGVLPENLEGAVFGHSLKTYGWVYLVVAAVLIVCTFLVLGLSRCGRSTHCVHVPGVRRIAGRPVGRDRRRRNRVHQCRLVDALLPNLVADLRSHRSLGDLRARRIRR